VTIVAATYCSAASIRLDQLIKEPARLMATLIHRDTVSTSILDHIRRSELQNGKSHGRIGELVEKSLDRAVTGTKQEE